MDFAKPSNEEGWANQAKKFFDDCHWEPAKNAYERAGKHQAASVADAYLKRERARQIPSEGRGKERVTACTCAANAFELCAQNAADESTNKKYLKLSANCLEEGNNIQVRRAADLYRDINCVSDAARLYRKLQKFDEIYDIITKSDKTLTATIPDPIKNATRLYFISKKSYV